MRLETFRLPDRDEFVSNLQGLHDRARRVELIRQRLRNPFGLTDRQTFWLLVVPATVTGLLSLGLSSIFLILNLCYLF